MEQAIGRAVNFIANKFEGPIMAIPQLLMRIHQEQKRHNEAVEVLLQKIAEK